MANVAPSGDNVLGRRGKEEEKKKKGEITKIDVDYTKTEAYVGFSLDICALSVLFITLVAVDKKFESTIKANAAITPILCCCVDILVCNLY